MGLFIIMIGLLLRRFGRSCRSTEAYGAFGWWCKSFPWFMVFFGSLVLCFTLYVVEGELGEGKVKMFVFIVSLNWDD